jgi:hypothetical protein
VKDIKSNNEKTGYSHHILNAGHAFGKLENTLDILNIQRKENRTYQLLNEVQLSVYKDLRSKVDRGRGFWVTLLER